LKLLIVSGPYEGELFRRAAVAAGLQAEVPDAGELLEGQEPLPGVGAVLLTTSLVAPSNRGALSRLRERVGQGALIAVLGDPEMAEAAGRGADVFFGRPIGAEDLIEKLQARAAAGRTTAAAAPVSPATLEPLRPEPSKAMFAPLTSSPGRTIAPGRILDRLAASIDDALDAEMLEVARIVSEPPAEPGLGGGDFASPAPITREAPRALVETMRSESALPALAGEPTAAGVLATAITATSPSLGAAVGSLADADLPMLIGRAYAQALTGRLWVKRDDVEKSIYFEAGRPVLATSNATQDRMIELFLRQGRITPAQHAQAVRAAAETGRRMGALLIDLGIMKTAELLPAVREHYEEIIFSLFPWEAGDWSFESGMVADPRRIRLLRHPGALVTAGLKRAYPLARMQQRLGSGRNVFVLDVRGSARDVLLEIGADGAERRVPPLFDGVRSFDDVVKASGLSEELVYRIALALFALRLLVPAAAAPSAPAPGPRSRDHDIERERIRARHALVRDGDYFQILGVARSADRAEVRRAYERRSRELGPDGCGPELVSELSAEIEAIREAIGEALRILGDDELRSRYREGLPAGRRDESSADPAAEGRAGS
jgi:hypothetical protein